jgi:hypothetical protein
MSKQNEKAVFDERHCCDFAMTFEEIGSCLNISAGMAWYFYQRGLRKLRKTHPRILSDLHHAAIELDAHRCESHTANTKGASA